MTYNKTLAAVSKRNDAFVPSGIYTKAELVLAINQAVGKFLTLKPERYGSFFYFNGRKLMHVPKAKLGGNMVTLFTGVFEDTKEMIIIRPQPKLCTALGIEYETIVEYANNVFDEDEKHYAIKPNENVEFKNIKFHSTNRPYDNITTFNVYSSVCQNRIVGTLLKPLLRIVRLPTHMPFGDQFTIAYENPQYISLRTNQFDEIWIKIKESVKMYDAEEEEGYIPFQFGETVATLHFRRISDYEVASELSPPDSFEYDDPVAKPNPLDTDINPDDVELIVPKPDHR